MKISLASGFTVRALAAYSTSANQETAWKSAKPFSEIPSLPMLPVVGTAWHYMPIVGRYRVDQRHIFNKDKRRRLGDIVRDKMGPLEVVACYTAEDLQEVLKHEGTYPHTIDFSSMSAYRNMRKQWYNTNGLLFVQGKEWHNFRSKTQKHLLKPKVSIQYMDPVQNVAKDLIKRIYETRNSNNEVPNFMKELYKYTLESFAFIGFDTRLGCLKENLSPESDAMKMIEAVMAQFDCILKLEAFLGNIEFWKYFNTPTWKKFVDASDIYTELAFKYINKAVADLDHDGSSLDQKLTLIQELTINKELDVRDIMVLLSDFLMAGIQSTSHSIGFLLYRLAKNPEKQERLYQEIIQHLPLKEMRISDKVRRELSYLNACFKESLRLNPVIAGTARHLDSNAVLSGYQVPAGTLVAVPYQEIFNDEKNYENPSEFVPERWLKKNLANPFAFVPFGFGPRSCIGKRIAELELVCAITEILRNFKVEYHHEDIGVKTLLVDVPDKELRFNFIER